jgi:hypothetical protein
MPGRAFVTIRRRSSKEASMSGSRIVTAAFVLGIAVAATASADPPFVLHGKAWKSQQAFVESGARCATRQVDEYERSVIDRKLTRFLAKRGSGGGSARPGSGDGTSTTPITIPVYVHVIHDGVNGNLTNGTINRQVEVLNDSYGGQTGGARTRFTFVLAGVTRTLDATWSERVHGRTGRGDRQIPI